MPVLKAKKLTRKTLILFLILSLFVTSFPPALFANKNDLTYFAGDGTAGFSGDGGEAIDARLWLPQEVAADSGGNLYIADMGNSRVRRVDPSGKISSLDIGGLGSLMGIDVDNSGNLYVAGEAPKIFKYAGGAVTSVLDSVYFPVGAAVNGAGSLIYFAENGQSVIYKVEAGTGDITTVAGIPGAAPGYSGDGGPATLAELNDPRGVMVDAAGNLYIADSGNHRIRRVDAGSGIITTVAGNGTWGYAGDGGAATAAQLNYPTGLAFDRGGNLYIADRDNLVIRKVDAASGIITTEAGGGDQDDPGNGIPATSFRLSQPEGVAIGGGNLYIADSAANRVHKVQLTPNTPIIGPNGGTFSPFQTVTIGNISPGDKVYYTTDGSDPTVAGAVYYTDPFTLTSTTTVKAAEYDPVTGLWGNTATATFTRRGGGGSSSASTLPPPPPPPVLPVVTAPVVNTDPASEISLTGARLNGSISGTGGAPVTKFKFRYRLKGDSGWQDTPTVPVSLGDGDKFSASVDGLKFGATYEFQARACNSAGWGEGSTRTFITAKAVLPKVVTRDASGVNIDSAVLNGSITDTGGAEITGSGFKWGTFDRSLNLIQVNAAPGSGGSLTFNLNGLTPKTKYYFQAYATSAAGTGYGELLTFETPLTPPMFVTTLEAAEVTARTATLHGKVTGGGAVTYIQCGFRVSPFTGDVYASPGAGGSFSVALSELNPDTEYTFTAFAVNASGSIYGSAVTFATPSNIPQVETRPASGVAGTGATLNGYIHKNNGHAIVDGGFLWGTDPQPVTPFSVTPGGDGRTLTYSLTGLQPGTTYYARAYANNSEGTGYGNIVSFSIPAVVPTLTTSVPVTDGVSTWNASLTGGIDQNGGAPITEYGFMYKHNSPYYRTWNKIVSGTDNRTGVFTAGMNAPPTTNYHDYYLVMAYAVNSAGTGYGPVKTAPKLPQFDIIEYEKSSLTPTSVGLTAYVIVVQGTTCYKRGFQYRPAGSEHWLDVGMEEGVFTSGYYNFNLTGLKPAAKYEFRARAYNDAGWASSDVVTVTAGYGNTDKEAAVNMRAAGHRPAEIANVLKNQFRDTQDAAIVALQYAGFGAVEIAGALRWSSYYRPQDGRYFVFGVAASLKYAGFDSLAVAEAMLKVFPADMQKSVYNTNQPAHRGVAWALENAKFGSDEIARALKEVCRVGVPDAAAAMARESKGFTPELAASIYRAYGEDDLAAYCWQGPFPAYTYYIKPRDHRAFVGFLKRLGLDGTRILILLKSADPSLDAGGAAAVYCSNGYSAAETGALLVKVFSTDPAAVAGSLIKAGYRQDSVKDFLVKSMGVGAQEMARIMMAYWRSPSFEIPRVLTADYRLGPLDLAKTLYAAGWNEENNGEGPKKDGCGLKGTIMYLARTLNIKNPVEVIGILRELGLSPLGVALTMQRSHAEFGDASGTTYFLGAYRQQGYAATDAAVFVKSLPQYNVYNNINVLKNSGGYGLKEIVLAVRNVYGLDAAEALKTFTESNRSFRWGWADSEIVAAITEVYNQDPYLAVIQAMKNAGAPAVQVAATLKDLLKTGDPLPIARYLVQLGYGGSEVLTALAKVFPNTAFQVMAEILQKAYQQNPRDNIGLMLQAVGVTTPGEAVRALKLAGFTLEDIARGLVQLGYGSTEVLTALAKGFPNTAFQVMAEILQKVYQQNPVDNIGVMLQAIGVTTPGEAVRALKQAGFTLEDIALALRDLYKLTAAQATDLLTQSGFYQREEILVGVQLVYGLDPILAQIQLMKEKGAPVADAVRTLQRTYMVSEQLKIASYLARAGYGQTEALGSLVVVHRPAAADIQLLISILREVYQQDQGGFAAALRVYGAVDAQGAVGVLLRADYTVEDTVRALKDHYNCDAGMVLKAFTSTNHRYFRLNDPQLSAAVKAVFGGDYTLASIQYYRSIGRLVASSLSDLRNEFGIADFQKRVVYLKEAGYPDSEVLLELSGGWEGRENIALVLKNVYGVADPAAIARMLREGPLKDNYNLYSVASNLQRAFPGIGTAGVALALRDAGYPVGDRKEDYNIAGWLRSYAPKVQDDAAAAILGSAKPGDLSLDYRYAVDILRQMGYDGIPMATWLRKNNYSPGEIFYGLHGMFSSDPKNAMLNTLKVMRDMGYDIKGLALAYNDFYNLVYHQSPGEIAIIDLRRMGYNWPEIVKAVAYAGAVPIEDLPSGVRGAMYYLYVYLREYNYPWENFNIMDIARWTYDGAMEMPPEKRGDIVGQIAKGLVNARGYFPEGMYEAMKYVTVRAGTGWQDKLSAADAEILTEFIGLLDDLAGGGIGGGIDRGISGPLAINALRSAGLSCDDMCTFLKDDGFSWSSNFAMLVGGGYDPGDAWGEVSSRTAYKAQMTFSFITTVVTSVFSSYKLVKIAQKLPTAINVMRKLGALP